ncbi:pyridoxamine 5'-phosphate oxidase family protein [Streptomyces sp. NPDC059900]|uniref:pyridoxamine 5'-phosphate oxidase family protein n=1 Tax=Streptomyces sp. NPDC059900 TaxID=3155816 RepID=UPI0034323594
MALSRKEREQFLAEPHVAAIGVAAAEGRGPLLVPIWYAYEPGGLPWILTGVNSLKMQRIKTTGRFSLLVQRTTPTVRYVSVEGPVAEVTEAAGGVHRELASRYLEGDALDSYLAYAEAELSDHAVVRMRPKHWLSADLGGG